MPKGWWGSTSASRAAEISAHGCLRQPPHGIPDCAVPIQPDARHRGVILGTIIGVLPGLGGANGVAILLPVTFVMPPTSAIILLSCIYWGALFGGAITSILFNIPGEPWSVATTFDGHPLARQGKGGQALTAAFASSFIGAAFAIILVTFCAPYCRVFSPIRPAGISRYPAPDVQRLRRPGRWLSGQDSGFYSTGFHPGSGWHGYCQWPAPSDLWYGRAYARLQLCGGGYWPLRYWRDLPHDGGRIGVQGRRLSAVGDSCWTRSGSCHNTGRPLCARRSLVPGWGSSRAGLRRPRS